MKLATPAQRAKHEELWRTRELYEPVGFIAEGLRGWHGDAPYDPEAIVRRAADLERGIRIARVWEATPDQSRHWLVRKAYRLLNEQTAEMWRFAVEALGVCCATTLREGVEPYATGAEQAADLRERRTLITETGLGGDHPLMSRAEYDSFRAVHDLLGHAGLGTGFDRHGEYQAFLGHNAMYTGLARWAMASEYRGVNSSLWAGHAVGAGKACLLPPRLVFG